MKAVILLVIVLAGCSSTDSSKTREFIPGVYTRHFEALYSRGDDTLYISLVNSGNAYNVIRKSTFQRIRNKTMSRPEQRVESWSVIYNSRDKSLYEQTRERMLFPVPDSNKLLVGSSVYLKIK